MVRRPHLALIFVLLLGPLGSLNPEFANANEPVNEPFYNTWARSDLPVAEGQASRTWIWGPSANTSGVVEPYIDSPGGERVVQYFDKSRMEINNPDGDAMNPWYVTNGLLANELMTGRRQIGDSTFERHSPAEIPVAGDADDPDGPTYATMNDLRGRDARDEGEVIVEAIDESGTVTVSQDRSSFGVTGAHFVPQTDHTVASVFWNFMNSSGRIMVGGQFTHGSLFPNPFFATGYPLTEAYWMTVRVGGEPTDVLVQVFQRRVLTYTPGNPDGWRVEAGNVGLHYYHWVYDDPDEGLNGIPGKDPGNGHSYAQACLDGPESEFLELINQYRQAHGLDHLANSQALNIASSRHSEDMGERSYFSHISPDGTDPFQRMASDGYDYNTYRAENIAAGYSSADAVFDAWKESTGHNRNMLSSSAETIGIGRVEVPGSDFGVYWTTKFGGHIDSTPNC